MLKPTTCNSVTFPPILNLKHYILDQHHSTLNDEFQQLWTLVTSPFPQTTRANLAALFDQWKKYEVSYITITISNIVYTMVMLILREQYSRNFIDLEKKDPKNNYHQKRNQQEKKRDQKKE